MSSTILSPTQTKLINFSNACKSQIHHLKLQGEFIFKKKDVKVKIGKGIRCSATPSVPPAWPGTALVDPGVKNWEGPKPISVVGCTGSIGSETLNLVAEYPDRFRIVALAGGSNYALLAEQIRQFKPKLVALRNESLIGKLKEALAGFEPMPEILGGEEGVCEVARHPEAVTLVSVIVGSAGLKPTIAAIEAGKNIAIANKETLITGGPVVLPLARKHNVKILPADSEHSAIFQCIQGFPEGVLKGIILTASGGSFRDWPAEKLKDVTVADATYHPILSLGKKVTVDTATLFNKGLEVIEAHYLFGVGYDNIEIMIHREAIIHSLVETHDTSMLAQLALPRPPIPLLYTLSWPERIPTDYPRLDLCKLGKLTFQEPDRVKYPSIDLCYAAGRSGGTMPGVLSAANEKAVELFIDEKIKYLDIFKVCELTCEKHKSELVAEPSLEEILHYDQWARDYTGSLASSLVAA